MLLVFRQHRLASSATGGASVMLHTSSSSGAFACECAEQLIEILRLSTAAWRCGVQVAFLLQAFSFSNKKKMPKRGEYISFNYST